MKKITCLLPIIALFFVTSCEEKIKTWSGNDRIGFETNAASDTIRRFTFFFEADSVTQHIIWIDVGTEGFTYDFSRTIPFRQVDAEGRNAVPGTHYVAFDDPRVRDLYVIPARAASARIPIILLRHPSLETVERVLRIELFTDENQQFLLSTEENRLHRHIVFSDMVLKPRIWGESDRIQNEFFGVYGPRKHRFMADETGMFFDDDWFSEHFRWDGVHLHTWVPNDFGYISFLRDFFRQRLQERNEREGYILTEEDGTVVSFPSNQ